MARTTGIRFRSAGKIFYYDAGDLEVHTSAYVVVETAHGAAVGRVVIAPDQFIATDGIIEADLKPILRLATEEDVERNEAMEQKAKDTLLRAKELAGEMGLDMSINGGEFDLDGSQFTAYFTATERVDFRNLVRDLSSEIDARVQLLQVGDRDRAKLVDGIDICGERLCCSSWMTNFPAVSIRMAKEQDLPLNPAKISGVCGRLYCCLTFEYDDYKALRGTLPKVGSFVSTPIGEAKVNGIDFNREVVKLWLTDQHELVEVAAIDFQLQNGVAIRPMELVRKIEGPLRTIGEDSSDPRGRSLPGRSLPGRSGAGGRPAPAAPAEPATPREGGGGRREGGNERRERGRGGRDNRGGQQPENQGRPMPRPDGRAPRPGAPAPRPAGPGPRPRPTPRDRSQPAPTPDTAPPPSQPQPQPQAQGEAGVDGAARRRRRRRGRGRGGGGGAPGGEGAPSGE